MRLPRDLSATNLLKALKKYEYQATRQKGSHIRVTTTLDGVHHLTIPNHEPLKIGTLSSIIAEISLHFGKTKKMLFMNFLVKHAASSK